MANATDDFNRADGGLGANWTEDTSVGGAWEITSNTVRADTVNQEAISAYTAEEFEDDQFAQIEVVSVPSSPSGSGAGPAVRKAADGTGGYGIYADRATVYLTEYGAADLDSAAHTLAVGEVIKVEAIGTSIKGYIDGVEVLSATDATYTSGYPGLLAYRDGTGVFVGDNFEAGPIVSAGGLSIPVAMHHRQQQGMS